MKRINSIVLHIKILLALAVFFSANAFSNPNEKEQNVLRGCGIPVRRALSKIMQSVLTPP